MQMRGAVPGCSYTQKPGEDGPKDPFFIKLKVEMKLKEKVKIKSWEPQSSAMGSESHRAQRGGAEISAGPTLDPTPRALGSAQPQDP